jgi:hypothetical protein
VPLLVVQDKIFSYLGFLRDSQILWITLWIGVPKSTATALPVRVSEPLPEKQAIVKRC